MRRPLYLLAALLLYGVSVHARSLHWSSIDVDATIGRDGVLEVAETQAFVFDGDWNGGERTFNVRYRQTLEVLGIDRIAGGKVIPLARGSLNTVDGYQLMKGNVLRWRSRRPEDPPFDNTALTYRIRYRLRGVLRGRNGAYRLDHDFLFPDRGGVVRRFSLRLRTDPAWSGIEPVLTRTARNLVPGEGYVITRELQWNGGATPPAAVTELPSPIGGRATITLIVIGMGVLLYRFYASEKQGGRFGGLTPGSDIDDAWLQSNIFAFSPEAIGAAWDGDVGAPEVAAVIASLAQEKKIETSVERRFLRRARLRMRLLCDRNSLRGHHGEVVRKLFFNNRRETDTDAIRKHYRGTGLDLAALVSAPVEDELSRIHGWTSKPRRPKWALALALLLASVVVAIVIAAWNGGNDAALVSTTLFFGAIGTIGSLVAAKLSSDVLTKFPLRAAIVFAFIALPLYFLIRYLMQSSEYLFGVPAMLACASFILALVHHVLLLLRTTEPKEKIAFRKKVISARRYLLAQLRSAEPRLRDEWFPYLLALGLGENVESWFRSHGAPAGTAGTSPSSTSSSAGSSTSSSGWTGGGGSFGGAGATGSWAVAAAAVGAGVSTPSSSSGSSGGSSSSSSSSSGGGGGGGW
jgi:uncharacterized membrane protein YgcG